MVARCTLVLLIASFATVAHTFALGPRDVVFHVFTRDNQLSEPLLPTIESIQSAEYFALHKRTVFTVHGHNDWAGGYFNAYVINAHIYSEDVNVIAVDWSRGASTYVEGLGNAPQVGDVIAEFINILTLTFGYDSSHIRIVGAGLGGHIAGIAARRSSSNIPHIIAIDPSLIGWTHHNEKLTADSAGVVEVVHATAGHLGYDLPLGNLDFYPNGGSLQVGCSVDIINCSHTYAYAFYAESLIAEGTGGNKFVGTKCKDYEQAIALQCDGERDAIFGGTAVKTSESGIYTFITNPTPPLAIG